ncbi:Mosmo [Phodopus roborovskii]|uniref:Mosmo protein n=1 Tax=Phodopus roborovskii TaxID=109678 RepID=A0AAU9ZKD2_PHORO|nr:Mosmo [Phodopus roborovskii]
MDKLTIISGCLFLAADIFAIASIANPDWINTGESAGEVFWNHVEFGNTCGLFLKVLLTPIYSAMCVTFSSLLFLF